MDDAIVPLPDIEHQTNDVLRDLIITTDEIHVAILLATYCSVTVTFCKNKKIDIEFSVNRAFLK
jgi:putative hemolysin